MHPRFSLPSKFVVLTLLAGSIALGTVTPRAASANSMISTSIHLKVCKDVYAGRTYSSVKQLDPNEVKHTSLVGTATLCGGTDPIMGVDLASRACKGKMIVPVYKPVSRWKKPFVKAKFEGWACS